MTWDAGSRVKRASDGTVSDSYDYDGLTRRLTRRRAARLVTDTTWIRRGRWIAPRFFAHPVFRGQVSSGIGKSKMARGLNVRIQNMTEYGGR